MNWQSSLSIKKWKNNGQVPVWAAAGKGHNMANSLPSELIHLILEFTSEMNRMETGIRDESLEDTGKQTDWFAEFENRYALT